MAEQSIKKKLELKDSSKKQIKGVSAISSANLLTSNTKSSSFKTGNLMNKKDLVKNFMNIVDTANDKAKHDKNKHESKDTKKLKDQKAKTEESTNNIFGGNNFE